MLNTKINRRFFSCVLLVVSSLVVSSPAFAWFFIIPGSLTNAAIADAITAEEGFHYVQCKIGVVR